MRRLGLALCVALFCAAPLGAGLSGATYFAALPLAGLFFLGALILRAGPLRAGGASLIPALMLCLALASLLLGTGHLLRGLLGVQAGAPLLIWLALGLAALALGSLLWPAEKTLETDAFLETALKRLNDLAPGGAPANAATPEPQAQGPATAAAFEQIVSRGDADALAKFLAAAQEFLDDQPERADELPAVGRLVDISGQIEQEHPELAEALVDLAHRLENLAEEADDR